MLFCRNEFQTINAPKVKHTANYKSYKSNRNKSYKNYNKSRKTLLFFSISSSICNRSNNEILVQRISERIFVFRGLVVYRSFFVENGNGQVGKSSWVVVCILHWNVESRPGLVQNYFYYVNVASFSQTLVNIAPSVFKIKLGYFSSLILVCFIEESPFFIHHVQIYRYISLSLNVKSQSVVRCIIRRLFRQVEVVRTSFPQNIIFFKKTR